MVHPSDDDPQRLLRLLALKRYEVPPPGFFDRLPSRVLVSIRAGTEVAEKSRWQLLLDVIRGEPMIAGSYAALGVGALLFGVSVFQMAVDTDAASMAGTGLSGPGAVIPSPGMFMAVSAPDPALPSPPMPASVVLRIAPHSSLRGMESGVELGGFGSRVHAFGSPSDYRLDGHGRVIPVQYLIPSDGR